jgi:hypothetical protein
MSSGIPYLLSKLRKRFLAAVLGTELVLSYMFFPSSCSACCYKVARNNNNTVRKGQKTY